MESYKGFNLNQEGDTAWAARENAAFKGIIDKINLATGSMYSDDATIGAAGATLTNANTFYVVAPLVALNLNGFTCASNALTSPVAGSGVIYEINYDGFFTAPPPGDARTYTIAVYNNGVYVPGSRCKRTVEGYTLDNAFSKSLQVPSNNTSDVFDLRVASTLAGDTFSNATLTIFVNRIK